MIASRIVGKVSAEVSATPLETVTVARKLLAFSVADKVTSLIEGSLMG